MKFLLVVLFIILSNLTSSATICYSLASGNWESASTWSCGNVPQCGDTICIMPGHTVTVSTVNSTLNNTPSVYVEVYGTLHFGNGRKLMLGCGSSVCLMSGSPAGTMTAAGGGGASNQLEICNTLVWQASDGNQTGPKIFTGPNPLPVELIYFKAEQKSKTIELTWATATELNNSHFIIERSEDGYNFKEMAKIKGHGTINRTSLYTYDDITAKAGLNYYRLIQVDYDGAVNTHDIISVESNTQSALRLFPNPSQGKLSIKGLQAEFIKISIYNVLGEMIHKSIYETVNETINLSDIPMLSTGTYMIRLENKEGLNIFNERLIVNN